MKRFRRLRSSEAMRDLVRETRLHPMDFVQPFFVVEGRHERQAIESMPGIFRYSVDTLLEAVEDFIRVGGRAGLFFGLPAGKDSAASGAYDLNGIVQRAVREVKQRFPGFLIITDVCLCAYMDHGHCGILSGDQIDNDPSVELLAKTALSHAQAGSDVVAPSDMMDFRVGRIREELDANGFENTAILSYAVKYASGFYGPFREAADSAPAFGDRKTYQMDPANAREALKEARADLDEGADFVMVKPALAYLDVVRFLRENLDVPIAAYNVSGEYSMVKAAARNRWIDERKVVLETMTSLKRAGAGVLITYHAQDVLNWIRETGEIREVTDAHS